MAVQHEIKYNKGENDEITYKKYLFENKTNCDLLINIFGDDAFNGVEIINEKTDTPYTDIFQIKKTHSNSKADIIILFKKTNKKRYCSVKSLRGGRPSIVNHTHRNANAFQNELKMYLNDIDKVAAEYNNKRTKKLISEDIAFGKLESSLEKEIRDSFAKLISYFAFAGTGKKLSLHACDCIFIINKDKTVRFIDCDTDEKKMNYIYTIIDTCVISFRNKGMPISKNINSVHLPWIYTNELNGKQCGSIHIRL